MPRGVAKEHLPSKVCATCNRPFTWRKVWEKCWDEVRDDCFPAWMHLKGRSKKNSPTAVAVAQQQ
jgi:hypothetical protein